jgi:hypothetical protein
MAQAVSRRPPTAEARVHVRVIPCGILLNKVALGQGFLRVLRFSPVSIIPPGLHIDISFGGSSSETVSPHKFNIKRKLHAVHRYMCVMCYHNQLRLLKVGNGQC